MTTDDWTLDGLALETKQTLAGWWAPYYPVPYALPPNLRLAMGLRSHALALQGSLRAVVQAVLSVHRPSQEDDPRYDPHCVGCWEAGGEDGAPSWPCPTVDALDAALQPPLAPEQAAALLATAVRVLGPQVDEAQQARDALVRVTAERDEMRDAVRAVLAIHRARRGDDPDEDAQCQGCLDVDPGAWAPWPCPTARAVTPVSPPAADTASG